MTNARLLKNPIPFFAVFSDQRDKTIYPDYQIAARSGNFGPCYLRDGITPTTPPVIT